MFYHSIFVKNHAAAHFIPSFMRKFTKLQMSNLKCCKVMTEFTGDKCHRRGKGYFLSLIDSFSVPSEKQVQ
jgi:hypothetical protein